MTKIPALVDSSFLYAIFNRSDRSHLRCKAVIDSAIYDMRVPQIILPEVAFLFRRDSGARAVETLYHALEISRPLLISMDYDDLSRARQIFRVYSQKPDDKPLDFVDCCLIAVAERIGVTVICTLDTRDFTRVKPAHCDFFTLEPLMSSP